MNRRLKILFVIVLLINSIFLINYEVSATSGKKLVGKFDGTGTGSVKTEDGESMVKKIVEPVLSVARIVAIGIGTIMITYLGIKYMSAAPNEKASIKTQLVTFTVGFAVVVGATTVLQIINKLVGSVTNINIK